MNPGLSFDQAPPFSVPLRFLLTAPLFLIVAAAIFAAAGPAALASRFTVEILAATHALTLGFLAMAMIGASLQMLPVVAGAPVAWPRFTAALVHGSLIGGTLLLLAGFLRGDRAVFVFALALIGLGFSVAIGAAGIALARAASTNTVTGMRLAWLSLLFTVILGIILGGMRAGVWVPPEPYLTMTAHVSFGLIGWILLLLVGVAYQVVPMFQITPLYPDRLTRWLVPVLFAALILKAAVPAMAPVAEWVLAIGAGIFAIVTLRLQSRRRRRLPDVNLDFWRFAMASLLACVGLWVSGVALPEWGGSDAYARTLGAVFLLGCVVSAVNGMLYKIVPFLAWFHLQAQLQAKAGSIPNMKEMIDEGAMRVQFFTHCAAAGLFVLSVAAGELVYPAAAALGLSGLLLARNLYTAVAKFSRHGGRFG